MSASKGIHSHSLFKLGKGAARPDSRNLMFAAILRAPAALPKEYDFDLQHTGIPTPMFANDRYGCCVIAGRAHQTLRFERLEQAAKLGITEKEVLNEYFRETGGEDSGLVVLDSLKRWRKNGWVAAKKRYHIQAFTQIQVKDHASIQQAIYLDVGVGLGLSLPKSAQGQVQAGKPWDVVSGPGLTRGSWGGHYVYVSGYTRLGPVCVTWGRKQQITWSFLDKYCDETYAIIDAMDTVKKKKALDGKKLKDFLSSL